MLLHCRTSTPYACALARLPAVSLQGYAFVTSTSSTAATSVLHQLSRARGSTILLTHNACQIDAVIRRSACHKSQVYICFATSLALAGAQPRMIVTPIMLQLHNKQAKLRITMISYLPRTAVKAMLAAAFAPKQSQLCGSAHQREARHVTMHLSR